MDHTAVIKRYRGLLDNMPTKQSINAGLPRNAGQPPHSFEARAHAKWMLDEIEEFVAQDKLGKANRWLGFVQGIFYSFGTYTINQMRDHNRPEPECSE